MRSAFRNLGILKSQWRFLVMKARSPVDGKFYFFVDKCLPFGASISCSHFQKFSDAVAHIVKTKTGKDLVNYLDDYLFVVLCKLICDVQICTFLEVCEMIRFPASPEKTFWGTTVLIFLGLLLDTVAQTISIAVDKIHRAIALLDEVLTKKGSKCKITLKQLQKLCRFLNFLCRAIIPGRAFTRHLYAYTATTQKKLKPHHHIRVNAEMRLDMIMWKSLLEHPSVFCQPFIDFMKDIQAPMIQMYSDASQSHLLGFGAICQTDWMYGLWQWDTKLMSEHEPSIAFLELYAVTAGILQWIHQFQNRRITLHCDNQSADDMINSNSSICKYCKKLIRLIVLRSLIVNVRVFAKYIPSKENTFADLLSRNKIGKFHRLGGGCFNSMPTEIPKDMWPPSKFFRD